MMWLNDGMHGRADKTSRTYTKVDKITGRTYAVTLRNPRYGKDFSNNQIRANNRFGALAMGVSAWVKLAKSAEADAADKAQYEKFVKAVKSQHNFPSVMSLIMGKRYATVNEALNAVTITDGSYTKTVEFVFQARPLVGGNENEDENENQGGSGTSETPGPNGAEGSEGNSGTDTVALTVTSQGNGTCSIDGGASQAFVSKRVAPGTTVNLVATPASGATFTQWSDGNTNASRTYVVNEAVNLTATFSGGESGGGATGPSEG